MKSRKKECHNGIFSLLFTTSNKTAQFYFWLKMTHLESVMGDKTTIRQSEIRGVYLGATCNHISRSSLMRKMELVTFITVTFCSFRNVWSTSHNFMEIFHGNKMIKRNDFPVSTKKFNDQYYYNQMVVLHLFAFSFSIRYELYPLEGFSFVCNSI